MLVRKFENMKILYKLVEMLLLFFCACMRVCVRARVCAHAHQCVRAAERGSYVCVLAAVCVYVFLFGVRRRACLYVCVVTCVCVGGEEGGVQRVCHCVCVMHILLLILCTLSIRLLLY